MTLSIELTAIFSRDLERVAQEVAAFPSDEALWQTKSGVTNSAGNLALHLEGNIREYIGRQIGGIAYQRERPFEFSATAPATASATATASITEPRPQGSGPPLSNPESANPCPPKIARAARSCESSPSPSSAAPRSQTE